jgi:membrane protease YdiL (CAAX protease family)
MFRGYMLFSLKKEIGDLPAVAVQMVPYAVLHMGKPEPEAMGSILFGLILGVLAVRGKSLLPCILLHTLTAVSMDLVAVLGRGAAS